VSPAWAAQAPMRAASSSVTRKARALVNIFWRRATNIGLGKSFRINRFTAGIHETVNPVFLTSLPAYTRSGWPIVVTHGHAIACAPPGSEMPLDLCQLCAGFVHEVCKFSARIVFVSCTDLARLLHGCALSLLLDSLHCSMVRAILFAPFPARRMCLAAARSSQGRVSGAANP